MKIKHWAGYGNVTAKKISLKDVAEKDIRLWDKYAMHPRYYQYTDFFDEGNAPRELIVQVSGDHEQGLERENDEYTIRNWLATKFVKDLPDTAPVLAYWIECVQYSPEVVNYHILLPSNKALI